MTKNEAILQMQKGYRVKHYLFSDDEFIYMKNGCIHDENDYKMVNIDGNGNFFDFWTDRTDDVWLDGWIVLPSNILSEYETHIIKNYHHVCYRPSYIVRNNNEIYVSKNSHKRTNIRNKKRK